MKSISGKDRWNRFYVEVGGSVCVCVVVRDKGKGRKRGIVSGDNCNPECLKSKYKR